MRANHCGRSIMASLGLVATVSLAACAAHPAGNASGTSNGQTASVPATPASTAAASPPAAAPSASATPAAGPGVHNLVITSAEKSELTAAFAGYEGYALSEVLGGGPLPGSVYYAYDPTTGTYWALADFELTGGMTIPIPMMFQKAGTGPWLVGRANGNGSQVLMPACSEIQWFPPAVLVAWSMPTTPPAGVTC